MFVRELLEFNRTPEEKEYMKNIHNMYRYVQLKSAGDIESETSMWIEIWKKNSSYLKKGETMNPNVKANYNNILVKIRKACKKRIRDLKSLGREDEADQLAKICPK